MRDEDERDGGGRDGDAARDKPGRTTIALTTAQLPNSCAQGLRQESETCPHDVLDESRHESWRRRRTRDVGGGGAGEGGRLRCRRRWRSATFGEAPVVRQGDRQAGPGGDVDPGGGAWLATVRFGVGDDGRDLGAAERALAIVDEEVGQARRRLGSATTARSSGRSPSRSARTTTARPSRSIAQRPAETGATTTPDGPSPATTAPGKGGTRPTLPRARWTW